MLCGAKTTKNNGFFTTATLTGPSKSPGKRGPNPGPDVARPFYSFLFVFCYVGGLPVGRSRLSPWWPSLASQVSPSFKISTPLRVLCVPFFLNTFSTALLVGQLIISNGQDLVEPGPGQVKCLLRLIPPTFPHFLFAHFVTYGGNGFPTLSPPNPPTLFFSLLSAPFVVLTRCAPSSH